MLVSDRQYLLALETSCDETAAAVIAQSREVCSSIVATQYDLHGLYGGVVPEIASRAHLERILPVIDQSLQQAHVRMTDLAAVAVATEPGLVGSLLVGLTAAKAIALVQQIPLVTVNHLAGHLYACRLVAGPDLYPAVGLVVSGGHTHLYRCDSAVELELLGATIDDAAGEAFDKVAQILQLGFPGGPAVEALAERGRADAIPFPRTYLHDPELRWSFSGLKTAVLYAAHGAPGARWQPPPLSEARKADLAASFQQAVVDVLVAKCRQALRQTGLRTLLVGGGVAANGPFRRALEESAQRDGFRLVIAPRHLCTDNAALGALGWELLERGLVSPLDCDVRPGLVRTPRS
jgi:N6-L-threonylcarbamoyladenine synthase